MVQDWAGLRRGDHSAARLQLEREALDWKRANGRRKRKRNFGNGLSSGNSGGVFSGADAGISPGGYETD